MSHFPFNQVSAYMFKLLLKGSHYQLNKVKKKKNEGKHLLLVCFKSEIGFRMQWRVPEIGKRQDEYRPRRCT